MAVRLLVTGYNVRKFLTISEAPQAELDSPAVSTINLVHKMEGHYGQTQTKAGKGRRNDRGIREARQSA